MDRDKMVGDMVYFTGHIGCIVSGNRRDGKDIETYIKDHTFPIF